MYSYLRLILRRHYRSRCSFTKVNMWQLIKSHMWTYPQEGGGGYYRQQQYLTWWMKCITAKVLKLSITNAYEKVIILLLSTDFMTIPSRNLVWIIFPPFHSRWSWLSSVQPHPGLHWNPSTPCNLRNNHQCFWIIYCFHLQNSSLASGPFLFVMF
jgi:hypothetical protein